MHFNGKGSPKVDGDGPFAAPARPSSAGGGPSLAARAGKIGPSGDGAQVLQVPARRRHALWRQGKGALGVFLPCTFSIGSCRGRAPYLVPSRALDNHLDFASMWSGHRWSTCRTGLSQTAPKARAVPAHNSSHCHSELATGGRQGTTQSISRTLLRLPAPMKSSSR